MENNNQEKFGPGNLNLSMNNGKSDKTSSGNSVPYNSGVSGIKGILVPVLLTVLIIVLPISGYLAGNRPIENQVYIENPVVERDHINTTNSNESNDQYFEFYNSTNLNNTYFDQFLNKTWDNRSALYEFLNNTYYNESFWNEYYSNITYENRTFQDFLYNNSYDKFYYNYTYYNTTYGACYYNTTNMTTNFDQDYINNTPVNTTYVNNTYTNSSSYSNTYYDNSSSQDTYNFNGSGSHIWSNWSFYGIGVSSDWTSFGASIYQWNVTLPYESKEIWVVGFAVNSVISFEGFIDRSSTSMYEYGMIVTTSSNYEKFPIRTTEITLYANSYSARVMLLVFYE